MGNIKFMTHHGRKYIAWEEIPEDIKEQLIPYFNKEWQIELIKAKNQGL